MHASSLSDHLPMLTNCRKSFATAFLLTQRGMATSCTSLRSKTREATARSCFPCLHFSECLAYKSVEAYFLPLGGTDNARIVFGSHFVIVSVSKIDICPY